MKHIQDQIKLANKAIEEMKSQNRIFDTLIKDALKNAPESDKTEIQKIQSLSAKVIALAKNGKIEEAEQLLKKFSNG